MKAVVVREFGAFDQATYDDVTEPRPGPGEVVVDIAAIDVNFPDILYIEGTYQRRPELPFTPGLGGTGRISSVGDGASRFSVGQAVMVLPRYGSYAEQVCVAEGLCYPMPEGMPFDVGAALGLVYQTAYFALVARGQFRQGDNVLVLGATGGIGMAAVQLAKAMGAKTVIAATRGAAGAALATEFGADAVVDASMNNLRNGLKDVVAAATGGAGVDIVIDPVGGDLNAAALRTMAWSGRLVVVGFASGEIPRIGGNYLLVKNIAVAGLQWTDYQDRQADKVAAAQDRIFGFWSEGILRPMITLGRLDQYAAALADLKHSRARGKLVLLTAQGQEHLKCNH